ncbi:MAG TPA: VWA domain-containing protein [Longimicrobiales bacterium]
MSFVERDLLWLAIVLPVLVAVLLWRYSVRRRKVAKLLGEARQLDRLGAGGLQRFPWQRLALLVPAALALGMAAAGPQWGLQAVEGSSSSVNIVLALDISKSMQARDVAPNRLERERLIVRRLLRDLTDARIGMVVFAGRAYILAPLTNDQSSLQLFVDALDPDIVSQGGSSLASAITQSAALARGPEGAAGERAVILITDGEAHEGEDEIMEAAERAQRSRVKIFTIAVGTEQGAPVPETDPESGRIISYKKDPFGETVISRRNTELLRDIARATGGRYYDISSGGSTNALVRELRNLERTPGASEEGLEPRDQTVWFIALAILLLAIDWYLARRLKAPALLGNGVSQNQRAAAAVILLLAFGTGWSIGDVERGNRLFRAGKYEEAARVYQEVIASGKAPSYVRYNLGTALLKLGRYAEAQQHLQLATREADAELKQRANYNLGNRYLEAARKGDAGEETTQLLDAAVEAYKQALRLDPADMDAKWNLELALREQQKQNQSPQSGANERRQQNQSDDESPASGGGGGSSANQNQPTGQGNRRGQNYEQRPMSQEEADRVLSAVEQDERELTREKLKKGQRRTPVSRDW